MRGTDFVEPMKALASAVTPAGQWRCEIKFDGYRAIAAVRGGRVTLWSRNHRSLSGDYPEVAAALRGLKCREALLDGEIVALDDQGRSRFQLLQQRDLGARPPIAYYVFDLLRLDGRDTMQLELRERQQALALLLRKPPAPVQLSPIFDCEPAQLLEVARKKGLEGIIAKKPGSTYEPGRRSGAWLKCKVQGEQEFVIAGFTAPTGSRAHFGALLVGYYQAGKLIYAGKVGTGFNERLLADLHGRFRRLIRKTPAFAPPMPVGVGRVTWLAPRLVAQIRFAEWTGDGRLRQPVFLGLRRDKRPRDVGRE